MQKKKRRDKILSPDPNNHKAFSNAEENKYKLSAENQIIWNFECQK